MIPLCVGMLGAAMSGAGPADSARAAGLTRVEVLAELADYQSVGYRVSECQLEIRMPVNAGTTPYP
ncbi:DUF4148 domain-containing protein [Paraburkholderia sp. RL18-103-BIB-C]|uniref:DUF4148 domain-containing protein n=1 Tax=unclassified Paraburkholderia TaxID=2615204 RepID=UPI002F7A855F